MNVGVLIRVLKDWVLKIVVKWKVNDVGQKCDFWMRGQLVFFSLWLNEIVVQKTISVFYNCIKFECKALKMAIFVTFVNHALQSLLKWNLMSNLSPVNMNYNNYTKWPVGPYTGLSVKTVKAKTWTLSPHGVLFG